MFLKSRVFFSLLILAALALQVFADAVAPPMPTPTPSASSYGMTSGRFVATFAAVVALIGVVIGGVAALRPSGLFGTSGARTGAIIAGLIGVGVGGVRVMTATGIGTGGGRAGAIVALVLGLIALALGALAIQRSRRVGLNENKG